MKQAGGLGGLVLQVPGAEKADPGELPNFEAICYLFTIDRGYSHVDANNVERILGEGYRFLMAAPVRSYAALDKGLKLAGRA